MIINIEDGGAGISIIINKNMPDAASYAQNQQDYAELPLISREVCRQSFVPIGRRRHSGAGRGLTQTRIPHT